MIRKDYIMRMIEEFARVLARLLGLKESKQYQDILVIIDQTFQRFFGLNSKVINLLSETDLMAMMRAGQGLDADKCLILAELLKEEGEIYEALDNPDESYKRYKKALNLFLEVFLGPTSTNLPDYFSEIEVLIDKLEKYELPAQTKNKLFRYYERTGKYAKAEDMLFEWMELKHSDRASVEEGIHFYERLLARSDGELAAGGLPRDEAEEGLSRLRGMERRPS